MSGSADDSNNIESSTNTVFIPELDHEDFVLQRQHELGSPDLVSLREGLGTSDGPTVTGSLFSPSRTRIPAISFSIIIYGITSIIWTSRSVPLVSVKVVSL